MPGLLLEKGRRPLTPTQSMETCSSDLLRRAQKLYGESVAASREGRLTTLEHSNRLAWAWAVVSKVSVIFLRPPKRRERKGKPPENHTEFLSQPMFLSWLPPGLFRLELGKCMGSGQRVPQFPILDLHVSLEPTSQLQRLMLAPSDLEPDLAGCFKDNPSRQTNKPYC